MEMSKLKKIIEGILFISGEPVALKKVAKVTGAKKEEITAALNSLQVDYQDRGLSFVIMDDQAQMTTHPHISSFVQVFLKSDLSEHLSKAALETLAIIAYRGPISRLSIEAIRGVNSSFILRTLLIRGLIERKPHPQDARSYLYEITFDLLKKLGLSKKEDLPDFGKLREHEALKNIAWEAETKKTAEITGEETP